MKLMTIVGARPQFIKAAVVSREFKKHPGIVESIIHTGQHYDRNMSDVFFEEMEIPRPTYQLNINSLGHGAMTGKMLEQIEAIYLSDRPDIVLVYGDTNSTLAGALAAAKLHIPVVHVEAGLRSFNKKMPEEINRILTDQISDILFCPTDEAIKNLKDEGFSESKTRIIKSGDVMLDASLYYAKNSYIPNSIELARKKKQYVLCTIHRPENTDEPRRLEQIFDALSEISSDVDVILPLHPRTKKLIDKKFDLKSLIIIDPVSYFEMIGLIQGALCVFTDSGGLQKEAYFFKKPCVTLRDQTEWVETLSSGCNKLVGADKIKILRAFNEFSQKTPDFNQSFYGEGLSAKIIVDSVLEYLSK